MSKPIATGEGAATLRERSLRDLKPGELDHLFLAAAKPRSEWMIGLELELFGFRRADRAPAEHAELARVLEHLAVSSGHERRFDGSGALVGLEGAGQNITLEPGGQLELATRPHGALVPLRDEVLVYAGRLREAGAREGLGFWALGYHPYRDHASMPHMPKERYDIMRAYFGRRGARALDMMHLTASVQCAVDFSDERNMTDKIRTAARVSPFLTALVASSPFSGGRPNGFKSVRYQVWREVDDDRSGLWPEMLDAEGLTFRRYVERAQRMPPLFFMRGGRHVVAEGRPFAEYASAGFRGTDVTVGDLLDHLTTFFPEIRPKAYVELRGADCVKPEEAVAIAGFWRGILDDEGIRREVDERLSSLGYAELRALQPEVARHGLDAVSAAGPVRELVLWLVRRSHDGLRAGAPDCAECLLPLVERAELGRSPADDLLEAAARGSVEEALLGCIV